MKANLKLVRGDDLQNRPIKPKTAAEMYCIGQGCANERDAPHGYHIASH
jgi:hypothetical protein